MADIKFSGFSTAVAVSASTIMVGAVFNAENIQFTPTQLAPFTGLYAANGTLASNRTITMGSNTLSLAQTGSFNHTVVFSGLTNAGMAITGGGNYIVSSDGSYSINSTTNANVDAISFQTNNGAGANASILINSRSRDVNADLHLKTATKLKISLPVAPGVNYVLKADDTDGNVSWAAQTNTEYTAGTGLDLTAGNVFNANVDGVNSVAAENSSTTAARTYKVQVDSGDKLVVNVPWATNTGTVTGTGIVNRVTKWSTGGTGIEDSLITDDGTDVKIDNLTILKGDGNVAGVNGKLQLNCSFNSHYVELMSPAHSGGVSYSLQFPNNIGTANQVLKLPASPGANNLLVWADDTDTSIYAANGNLTADRTVTMNNVAGNAPYNLTFAGITTSKVTFSNLGGVEIARDLTIQKNLIIQGQGYSELLTGVTNATFDWNGGNVQSTTLGAGTIAFAPTNAKAGATYIISIAQTGAAVINWGSYIIWPLNVEPTLSGNAKTDVVTLICYDDTVGADRYYGSATLGFTS